MSLAQAFYASMATLVLFALIYTLVELGRAGNPRYVPRNRRLKQKPCVEIGFRSNKPQEQR